MKRGPWKIILPVVVLGLGLLIARLVLSTATEVQTRSDPPSRPLVSVMVVEPTTLRFDVESQGTVTPATESLLSAQVVGRIEWVSPSFEVGAFFVAGEELLRIDPRDYELAVVRAESGVAQALLAVATEESEALVAREEWQTIGDGEADPLVLREPQLADARASAEAAQAELDRARLDLARTQVRAPYDGRVVSREVDVGQYVSAGTRLGRIDGLAAAEVRLAVPDADLAYLDLPLGPSDAPAAGPTVTLSATFAGRASTWPARIVRTEARIDPRTRMLHLVAEVEHPYETVGDRPPLKTGLFVQASIHGRQVADVVILPRDAMRDDDEVLVVDAEDRLRFRPVTVMRTERDRVVVSGGLEPGERVCTSRLQVVVDGMAVRVDPAGSGRAATGQP